MVENVRKEILGQSRFLKLYNKGTWGDHSTASKENMVRMVETFLVTKAGLVPILILKNVITDFNEKLARRLNLRRKLDRQKLLNSPLLSLSTNLID
jgi:hypothetical protein